MEVAEYVNEMKRASENIAKMWEIQENLTDAKVTRLSRSLQGFTLVAPARSFIREASFVKINMHGKHQDRHVFLFNDMVVYVKTQFFKRTSYQFKGFLPLESCLVNDIPDTEGFRFFLSLTTAAQNQIELVRIDQKKKKYTFCANTPTEKMVWLKDLNRIIDASLEKQRRLSSP